MAAEEVATLEASFGSDTHRVPGPDLPWWTQLRLIRRDFLGFLAAAAAQHGDIFCIRPAPGTRIVVLNSKDLVDDVLNRRADAFTKSGQTRFMVGKFLGNGLVLSEGDVHARQRRLLQPGFGARELGTMARTLATDLNVTMASWGLGRVIDVEKEMTRLSLRVIQRFLVGSSDRAFAADDANAAFRTLAAAIGGRFRSMPLPSWIPTPRNLRERQAVKMIDRLVRELLHKSRESGHQGRSLLATLGREHDAGNLSAAEVRDQMVTMLFAGHETVAKVLTWTLYLLAKHPETQTVLRDEINALVPNRNLEATDVPRLKQTANVIREAMRLYPPVWVFDRSPTLPLDLGGLTVVPKDSIYLSPYLLHRQERYFPDPLRFDPTRFENEGFSSEAFIPFGSGARTCIGQSMAMIEAVLTIGTIVKRFKLALTDSREVRPYPGATLGPGEPILLSLKRCSWMA